MKRSSGILLPVSALPSPHGIGTLGKAAFNFIDFLRAAGQTYWQMLPLGPTGFGDSPYQCASSYAGNPYFIDLDSLAADGFLTPAEIRTISFGSDAKKIDYGALYYGREELLRKAFTRSCFYAAEASAPGGEQSIFELCCPSDGEARAFLSQNAHWLENYAFFMALKAHFGMRSWQDWEDESIRFRLPEGISKYRELLAVDIRYHLFVQFLFFKQWDALKSYAKKRGIDFIGDLPIYVPLDSADVWVDPILFQLDSRNCPLCVSGVPPDFYCAEGQLWGSPIYDWEAMKADGYAWWMRRIEATAKLFDVIRIDHFRGLSSYWKVPYGDCNAVGGKWMPGPGLDFVDAVKERFPAVDFIAEDLGVLTEGVKDLLEASGFPGMRVIQFAFEGAGCSAYLPHSYIPNSVVYTGTHDNNTLWGWLLGAGADELRAAKEYFGLARREGWDKGVIRGGMSSCADLFVAQMQDYLEFSEWARMNRPGTVGGNWQWRMEPGQLTEELARNIAKMTKRYER